MNIKKINDKINEYLSNVDLMSFGVLVFTCLYLMFKYFIAISALFYGSGSINLDKFLLICTLLNLFIIILRIKNKELTFKKVDKIFLVLNIFYFLSVLFNFSGIAIFGDASRYEGLITLILYECIYFVTRSIKDKKYINKLIKLILYVGVVNSIVGMVQTFTNIGNFSAFDHMAYGLMDNPNMFGLFMVMIFSLALGLYLSFKGKKYLFCTLLFFVSIILSDSSASLATTILILLFTLGYYIKNKINIKNLIILYLGLIVLFPIVSYSVTYVNKIIRDEEITSTSIVKDLQTVAGSVTNSYVIDTGDEESSDVDVADNEEDNSTSTTEEHDVTTGRLSLWKYVLIYSKDHFWFGVGPDCMFIQRPQDDNIYFDKAHNHYLEVYYTSGIFAGILYIAFVVYVFISSNKKDHLSLALLLAFTAYSIDIMASISVPYAAIYYYLIIGMLMSLKDNILVEKVNHKKKKNI